MRVLLALFALGMPAAAAAGEKAPPQQPGGGGQMMIIMLVGMFAIMYFLMIRPQRKRQRQRLEMLSALSKNDHIVTVGGIFGTITLVRDHEVVIKVKDSDVKLTVSKSGVARVLAPEGEDASQDTKA